MAVRVVITGLGAVSPLGNSIDESWLSLCSGMSGIGSITKFDTQNYTVKIAGEVKGFDPLPFVSKSEARRFDNFTLYAVGASRMACEDAQLSHIPAESLGVVIGSAVGGLSTVEEVYRTALLSSPSKVSPFGVPCSLANIAAGVVAIKENAKGPINCTTTACAAGAHAIEIATMFIRAGKARAMITGGAEAAVTPSAVSGFSAMRTLSSRNDEPTKASRPFDRNRDGFVIAEGAGIIVIEELESARKRGAHIYAEIIGVASSADAFHIAAPPEGHSGAVHCMKMALRDAGINPTDVGYVNAHGTSTLLNDAYEAQAIKTVFGKYATTGLLVSSTKSMTGHMLGASGGFEAAVAVKAIVTGIIPPTINWECPDDDGVGIDFIPNIARKASVDVAMSCSFGFGGANCALLFKRWQE
ncbi:MAG: beta-ketoacyl-ACP synthase II [Deltaproteobacteria bacterium]|nr:beta-ketoacyl-ACP synthase II [Deltaproteobacteria bacterium]